MVSPLAALGWAFAAIIARLFYKYVVKAILSPLRDLPGPVSKGLFRTHIQHAMDPRISARAQDEWYRRFGPNYRIKGYNWFDNRLISIDPKVITYVMSHPNDYEKPQVTQRLLSSLIGKGLLASEGPRNHHQRKLMNPAFSTSNLRSLTPIFFRKAFEMRDRWKDMASAGDSGAVLNVAHWLSRATFDVIGLAGFDYEFNAIKEENEKIYLAYKFQFDNTINKGETFWTELYLFLPFLKKIFPDQRTKIIAQAQQTITDFGMKLVNQRKEEHRIGKLNRLDLLSLLMSTNFSEQVPEASMITDEEICNHINTFLFAGSDTTSIGLAWGLHLLAHHPEMQTRLREELVALADAHSDSEGLTIDASANLFTLIDKLPYLENVCREILRLIPPVHSTIRVAIKDDVIPVSAPLKYESGKWKDKERVVDGIHIAKGEFIHIPIEGLNLAKNVWGDDAHEFNPDRWDHLSAEAKSAPGLWANIMSFGVGPRSCIGIKFSMMEMKSMMFTLLPAFHFAPEAEIRKVNVMLIRPYVKGRFQDGPQLPLVVTPIDHKKQ